MVVPGDMVTVDGQQRVVVDVTGEDGDAERWAVHRHPLDLAGVNLEAADAETLTVVGHVDSVPGWVELAPGEWRRT